MEKEHFQGHVLHEVSNEESISEVVVLNSDVITGLRLKPWIEFPLTYHLDYSICNNDKKEKEKVGKRQEWVLVKLMSWDRRCLDLENQFHLAMRDVEEGNINAACVYLDSKQELYYSRHACVSWISIAGI